MTQQELMQIAVEIQESAARLHAEIEEVGVCRLTPRWQQERAAKYAAAREAYAKACR